MGFFNPPEINITVIHSLENDEVIKRMTEQLETKLQAAFPEASLSGLRQSWKGRAGTFSCKVDGRDITGNMSFNSEQLIAKVVLPRGATMKFNLNDLADAVKEQLVDLLS